MAALTERTLNLQSKFRFGGYFEKQQPELKLKNLCKALEPMYQP